MVGQFSTPIDKDGETELSNLCRGLGFAQTFAVEDIVEKFRAARDQWIKGGKVGEWNDEDQLKRAWAKIK